MRRRIAAIVVAMTVAVAAAPPPPQSAPPGVDVLEDGAIVARPSGLRLPRDVRGPEYTHRALISSIDQARIKVVYGPITLTIGPPDAAADPIMIPPGSTLDPDPPALMALLFWGESAQPETYSFFRADPAQQRDWLSFVVVAQGWQVELSTMYDPADRDVVIRTAEAVWATFASANESVRK
ncbi:MAG: hypothetical protein IT548_11820 [Alphaproteobacteria bacterium]|nr:hypothetical protein [Alphaproteobacteria bacterium]